MKNKEICDKVKEVLSKEQYVVAIFNNGSSVVGMDTPGSDVDFVVLVKKKSQIMETINAASRKLHLIEIEEGTPKTNAVYSINNKRVDLSIYPKDTMEGFVNHFYDSKENFLSYQNRLKHKIVDAVAVYDPQHLLKKYKKKVEAFPKKILDEVIASALKSLKSNCYYWEHHGFRNEFHFSFELWDVMVQICYALYAKNRKLFMLPYKRLHKDLKELKPNIEKEMYSLVRGVNSQKNIAKKVQILKKVIAKLEK